MVEARDGSRDGLIVHRLHRTTEYLACRNGQNPYENLKSWPDLIRYVLETDIDTLITGDHVLDLSPQEKNQLQDMINKIAGASSLRLATLSSRRARKLDGQFSKRR